jgi:hypothetical protein
VQYKENTIMDGQTPENLTSYLGAEMGVDIFLGVGSGSGLPQTTSFEQYLSNNVLSNTFITLPSTITIFF